jgi:hypothetical protein
MHIFLGKYIVLVSQWHILLGEFDKIIENIWNGLLRLNQ